MGTPVPIIWPVIEPTKIYRIAIDAFTGDGGATGCDRPNIHREECCKDGVTLQAMIDTGAECIDGFEYCFFTGFSAQRLIAVHGPYTLLADCLADI